MNTMQHLIQLLHEGPHSLVLRSTDGRVHCYDGRGISDLLHLLQCEPRLLQGAEAADKVVGKAAAALMIEGGVARVHADLVSQMALQLAESEAAGGGHRLQLDYTATAPHIVNRQGDGWCPMETACRDCATARESVESVRRKLKEMKEKNKEKK